MHPLRALLGSNLDRLSEEDRQAVVQLLGEKVVVDPDADHYPHRFSKRLATRQPSTSNVKSRRPRVYS